MAVPLHAYASVPVAAAAGEVNRRLRSDAHDLVIAATAAALASVEAGAQRCGLRISEIPMTTGRASEADEVGSIEVAWAGREDATGWPALTGRVLVVPEGEGFARLLLLSSRSPDAELLTGRVDGLHRRRLASVGLRSFLRALAAELDRPGRDSVGGAIGVPRIDRTPMFVHHLQSLASPCDLARTHLLTERVHLAERATKVALERADDVLTSGRFRSAADPIVRSRAARIGEPAALWIGWSSDEEATGWPELDLGLALEPYGAGSRLTVVSRREPRFDLSTNRVDKRQRHRLLEQVGKDVAQALRDEVDGALVGGGAPRPPLVAADS
jgi:hypothetical protein